MGCWLFPLPFPNSHPQEKWQGQFRLFTQHILGSIGVFLILGSNPMGTVGFEPTTPRSSILCSTSWSYVPIRMLKSPPTFIVFAIYNKKHRNLNYRHPVAVLEIQELNLKYWNRRSTLFQPVVHTFPIVSTGLEPVSSLWKSDVLTTRRWDQATLTRFELVIHLGQRCVITTSL